MKKLIALLLALDHGVSPWLPAAAAGAGNELLAEPASTPASSGAEGDKSAAPLETTGTEPQYGGEGHALLPQVLQLFSIPP